MPWACAAVDFLHLLGALTEVVDRLPGVVGEPLLTLGDLVHLRAFLRGEVLGLLSHGALAGTLGLRHQLLLLLDQSLKVAAGEPCVLATVEHLGQASELVAD
jgi:hypothetical protein